jgi:hypothetical protein
MIPLLPYLHVATIGMQWDFWIEYKEGNGNHLSHLGKSV